MNDHELPEVTTPVSEWPAVLQAMQQLQESFDTKIKYDDSKQQTIDSLHAELQAYREGLHFKILRPVIMDLIAMYDDMAKLAAVSSHEGVAETILSFRDTLEEILSKHGVEIYSEEGEVFTAKRQQVVKTVPTDKPEKDKLVATHLYKGFSFENRILRPERVAVFKYQVEVSHE